MSSTPPILGCGQAAPREYLPERDKEDEGRKSPMHKLYTAVSPKERGGSIATTEEYAGYTVCDPQGQRIGRTERIFLNGRGEPEYIKVKMGLFSFKSVLLPVQSVAADEERCILVLQ
jgi:hypothetical protein